MHIGTTINAARSSQQSPSDSTRRLVSPSDSWLRLLVTFLVLLACSWFGIALSRQSEGVATIWFTNGILFALVITKPRNLWVRYFLIGILADTLADVIYGDPFRLSIGIALANSVEVITSCLILTRWFGHPFNLSKRRPLLAFLGVAVIGATAITSALGASWTMLFVNAGPWWRLFRTWYLGDILGMAIIAPLVFILQRPGFFSMLQREKLLKTLSLIAIPAVATVLVFNHSSDPLIFFIFPPLLLVVFRLGFPGTVLAIFVVAGISIGFTVSGRGPLMLIADSTMLHRIVIEQIFVAVALFTTFPVAALLEERKALELSLQKSEQRYRELANADALTGLANRRGFDEQLEAEWQRATTAHESVAILLMDVDLFKSYNDIYGHIGGDECLRCIANVIAGSLQRSSDRASRFGGEEFAVILPNTELDRAFVVAENIRKAVAAMNLPHPHNPHGHQTISIGVAATIPIQDESALSLLTQSDHALYRAKDMGRNRVEAAINTDSLVLS
jgi:diguanylate cyclase (GGDEF)-like protein